MSKFIPKRIIIHCTASTFGDVAEITKWHKKRGFSNIGYHYLIVNGKRTKRSKYSANSDGDIETGRSMFIQGAHSKGQNHDSIGICLVGLNKFTKAQFDSLRALVIGLQETYNIPDSKVYPHNKFNKLKTCPNFDVREVLGLKNKVTMKQVNKAIETLSLWKSQQGGE